MLTDKDRLLQAAACLERARDLLTLTDGPRQPPAARFPDAETIADNAATDAGLLRQLAT
jgi:hypothetical protein